MSKWIAAVLCLALPLAGAGVARQKQQRKPWTEWTLKEAEKILNDSAWGRTQVETDTSEMFFRPQPAPNVRTGAGNADPLRDARGGATNQATEIRYRIRFFSARPVRRALARIALLNMGRPDPQAAARLRLFAESPSNEKIIVSVTYESDDGRYAGAALQAFAAATAATLKNNTYLETKAGRLFVEQYVPPGREGYGALFVFPRSVRERPFITRDDGEVRFFSEVGRNVKLDMRFDVAQMTYEGSLEY
jgi:hypothetical protein